MFVGKNHKTWNFGENIEENGGKQRIRKKKSKYFIAEIKKIEPEILHWRSHISGT